jgi:aminoglycoside phosphotransferase (APT) family kinase protein
VTGTADVVSASVSSNPDDRDDVALALARLAHRLRGPAAHAVELARLTAGASMQTWSFAVESPIGRERLILRRRTAGSHSSGVPGTTPLDLRLEAGLMRAAGVAGAPVAEVVHVCDPSDGLGQAHVTRFVNGETLGRRIVADRRFDAVRPQLAWQCGQALARVHSVCLDDLDQPEKLEIEDATRTLDRYEASYRTLSQPRPVIELALQYLRRSIPEPGPITLVHGDFRNGNLMVAPDDGVVAVLDWELAHLGDPVEDLAYICVNSWRFRATKLPVGGFGEVADLIAGYRAAGGRPVTSEQLRYWQLMGSLKWAIICVELFHTWLSGADRSVERPMIGRRVSEAEIDMLTLLREIR